MIDSTAVSAHRSLADHRQCQPSFRPILTTADVAALLECTEETVATAARAGRLAGVQYGRAWVFPIEAFLAALNAQALDEKAKRETRVPPKAAGLGRPEAANASHIKTNPRAQQLPTIGELKALLGVEPGG